jgi:transcriptional regulator with XRE-family HTH domain
MIINKRKDKFYSGEDMNERRIPLLKGVLAIKAISQRDFAGYLGVSEPTLSNYCRGITILSLEMKKRIAEALGMTVEEIFPE